MNDHTDHECWNIGGRNGVLCAFLGAVIALAPWIPSFVSHANPELVLNVPIAASLLALFMTAGFFGTRAGMYLCKQGNDTRTNVVIGIALAFGSIAVSVWAGMISFILGRPSQIFTNPDMVMLMLFFAFLGALFWGAIPAIGLGALYGFLVKRQLKRLHQEERRAGLNWSGEK